MLKLLLLLLLCFTLALPPVWSLELAGGTYVAVISSKDLSHHWTKYKSFPTDYFIELAAWDYLDGVFWDIKGKSGTSPIFLDFMVHGGESGQGLVLGWAYEKNGELKEYVDRASMGYVLNKIKKWFAGRDITVAFESCYAGRAYKSTIRGMQPLKETDNVGDFVGLPEFPVVGVGDSFAVAGQPMYIQFMCQRRKWWVDLRDYDSLGKNKKLSAVEPALIYCVDAGGKMQPTTYEIYQVVKFFRW